MVEILLTFCNHSSLIIYSYCFFPTSTIITSIRSSSDEPQRACLRLSVAGGRAAESPKCGDGSIVSLDNNDGDNGGQEKEGGGGSVVTKQLAEAVSGWAPPMGALALGARTMQEGGALGGLSRTQVGNHQ